MWRKVNPSALLVGMQTGADTVESSVEIPQKIKSGSPFLSRSPISGNISEGTLIRKNISTPMSTAALFTIAKIWKQPKCPSVDEWIKLWDIYTMEYYSSIKKKKNLFFVTI